MKDKGKWKQLFSKKENFLVLLLVGILLLVIAWPASGSFESNHSDSKSGTVVSEQVIDGNRNAASSEGGDGTEEAYARGLETQLEEILSVMEGVGQVKVMITIKDSGETYVEKDTPSVKSAVTEVDAQGSRNTSDIDMGEETVYMTETDGTKIPYVIRTTKPEVAGVLVAAEGGGSEKVSKNITDAIMSLFGLEAHKIIIVKMISEQSPAG